jgi:hypothetical protein
MKKTIHAKVVAKALSFPDQIEIDYYPVDELESGWARYLHKGAFYVGGGQVKIRAW